ncbi:permease [Fictibacillus phosphorivorans]|uniref:permease n=1 Tax=Fictibacillus phosphorivorans TaxID=1221500 RepID=UPI00203CE33F|nr:permease [Fictibacillus phosphorivorans]MCM3717342.1 permease [Fictibacillus phosphorivorans]MCM3775037.1 permease [Fictibacillus phosphorivorans]
MLDKTFLQMNTVFISILIEALPFVLIGVLIAGVIQMFVTEEMVARIMPKNKGMAVLFAAFLGAIFPACECGIVPITRRLIAKGVPVFAAIPFMLTGPIINPVVLFSTFVAFGNQWDVMIYRGTFAMIVAVLVGLLLAVQFKNANMLKNESELLSTKNTDANENAAAIEAHPVSFFSKLKGTFVHAVEEFFSVGKYLVIGALIAAGMQTYVKTSILLEIGQGEVSSSLVMMGLAFVLSLCSEADAFIASSFQSTFTIGSIVAFLVYGPMLDIKNVLMMLAAFKKKLVFSLIAYITVLVWIGSLFL